MTADRNTPEAIAARLSEAQTIADLAARLTAARNALLMLIPLVEEDTRVIVESHSLPRDLPWTPGQPLPPSLSPGEPERLAVARVNALTAARSALGQQLRAVLAREVGNG